MQSVATIYGEIIGGVFTPKVCYKADAHLYHPPIEDGHVTYSQAVCTLALCIAVVCQWSIEVSNIGRYIYKVYDNYATQMVT
jgi:hypothetical protein